MKIEMHPIGVIHSPFKDAGGTPIQSIRSSARGQVEVFPEFSAGLRDLEELSHIYLIYVFHRSEGFTLVVQPFLDDQEHGLFATRYPSRPNQIGISVVRLLERRENILSIEGVDMLDETPLLDIKPYLPEFDHHSGVRAGWYEHRSKP
jgi:tRNA-Thr(GGU) m(6)t(6)A37 methyltransferase TsaA